MALCDTMHISAAQFVLPDPGPWLRPDITAPRKGEQMTRAGFRLRLAAVTVAVAAAVPTAASTLTPALAATGPAMTVNHGSVNIAVQGPNDSLLFYWAVNGTSTWHAETVAAPAAPTPRRP